MKWNNFNSDGSRKTLLDCQRETPNYLNAQLPRQFHGWNFFTKAHQEAIKTAERNACREQGYTENPDGSFTK